MSYNKIAIKYDDLESAVSGIDGILTTEIPDMEQELRRATSEANALTFASVTTIPAAQRQVMEHRHELGALKSRINKLSETTHQWEHETASLFESLTMGIPVEFDENGEPKATDWSTMVSALGERQGWESTEYILKYIMPDGEPNWEAIKELLGRETATLTDAELGALAKVYMALNDPNDLATFINAMCVQINSSNSMGSVVPPAWMSEAEREDFFARNTIWEPNFELTNAIRARVEAEIANLLVEEWLADEYAGALIQAERMRLLQHSAVLYAVSTLAPVTFEDTERDMLTFDNPEWNRANPQAREVIFEIGRAHV